MALTRKDQLIFDLQRQRENLSRRYESLKQEAAPGHLLINSLQRHPIRWAATAGGSAFLVSRLMKISRLTISGRRKKRGLIIGTGSVLFKLARPALTTFALQKGRDYLESRLNGQSENSMLGGSSQK